MLPASSWSSTYQLLNALPNSSCLAQLTSRESSIFGSLLPNRGNAFLQRASSATGLQLQEGASSESFSHSSHGSFTAACFQVSNSPHLYLILLIDENVLSDPLRDTVISSSFSLFTDSRTTELRNPWIPLHSSCCGTGPNHTETI